MTPEKELLEKRAGLMYQLEDYEKQIAGRKPTAEESAKWDEIYEDVNAVNQELERGRKIKEQMAVLAETRALGGQAPKENGPKGNEGGKEAYRKAFDSWIRKGESGMTSEERSILQRGTNPQSVGTAALGGYTVPEEFGDELIKAMAYYGGMLDVSTVIRTATGAAMPFPSVDETAVTGRLVAENAALAVKDIAFGSTTLNAYMYTSDIVKLSYQLMQDNGVNLEGEIMPILAERLGRILNTHLTVGDGSGKPTGVVTSASAGTTSAAEAAITRGEIIDLQHSLDIAYQPNARFMMNYSTLAAIRKLSLGSSDASPLWQPSMREGAPDLLEGKPYTINNDLDDLGTSNVPLLYGDFSKYRTRITRDVQMAEMNELYVANLQKGFTAFMRADGALLDTKAVKKLTNDDGV